LIRLDKLVSKSLGLSRKEASKLIRSGRVSVNNAIEKSSSTNLSDSDKIEFEGKQLEAPNKRYILLNKPQGYICSTKDEEYPSTLNLIDIPTDKLHFAGRLDADTTGLVLISDDGQWTHRITSPKHKHSKTYKVSLDEVITDEAIFKLENGVILKDSDKPTQSAKVKVINQKLIELSITEGRYHQVKRMVAAVGNHVVGLHRLAIGEISIPKDMEIGEWRKLTQVEVDCFR